MFATFKNFHNMGIGIVSAFIVQVEQSISGIWKIDGVLAPLRKTLDILEQRTFYTGDNEWKIWLKHIYKKHPFFHVRLNCKYYTQLSILETDRPSSDLMVIYHLPLREVLKSIF